MSDYIPPLNNFSREVFSEEVKAIIASQNEPSYVSLFNDICELIKDSKQYDDDLIRGAKNSMQKILDSERAVYETAASDWAQNLRDAVRSAIHVQTVEPLPLEGEGGFFDVIDGIITRAVREYDETLKKGKSRAVSQLCKVDRDMHAEFEKSRNKDQGDLLDIFKRLEAVFEDLDRRIKEFHEGMKQHRLEQEEDNRRNEVAVPSASQNAELALASPSAPPLSSTELALASSSVEPSSTSPLSTDSPRESSKQVMVSPSTASPLTTPSSDRQLVIGSPRKSDQQAPTSPSSASIEKKRKTSY